MTTLYNINHIQKVRRQNIPLGPPSKGVLKAGDVNGTANAFSSYLLDFSDSTTLERGLN